MAVRLDAVGDMVSRGANLPSTTSFSACGWAYIVSDLGAAYQALFSLDNASSYIALYWDVSSPNDTMYIGNGTSDIPFASRPSTGEWFFFALTCSGTGAGTFNGYWARAQDASFVTASGDGISFSPTIAAFGNDGFGDRTDCRLAFLKIWDAVLTPSELAVERHYGYPVRLANLNIFAPCWNAADAATDYGANKRNMTIGGTLTTEDGPPVRLRRSGPRASVAAVSFAITGFDPAPPFTIGQTGVSVLGVGFGV